MLLAAAAWPTAARAGRLLELTAVTEQLPGVFSLLLCRSLSSAASAAHDAAAGSSTLPLQRLQRAITADVCAQLAAGGYAVVDGVFGRPVVEQLKRELLGVRSRGLMHLNHTHLVSKGATSLLPKAHVWEAELTLEPAVQAAAPLIAQLNADATLATMLSLHMPQLRLKSQAIKLQHNQGSGGCFPLHFDSDAALDGRRVTAILYLNETWQAEDGGQLRLYPFPGHPVDIEPVADRLVLFASTSMLHRVLPSTSPRSCFTIWLSEGERRAHSSAAASSGPALVPPPSADEAAAGGGDAVWRFLMQPAVRQHVCKLALADEWERSIVESHPCSEATDAALANHRAELERIATALSRFSAPLEQLLAAADVEARVAGGAGSGTTGSQPSESEVQAAVSLLRQAAAHVRWF